MTKPIVNNYFTHEELISAISEYHLKFFGMKTGDAQNESEAIQVAKLSRIPKYLRSYLNASAVSDFDADQRAILIAAKRNYPKSATFLQPVRVSAGQGKSFIEKLKDIYAPSTKNATTSTTDPKKTPAQIMWDIFKDATSDPGILPQGMFPLDGIKVLTDPMLKEGESYMMDEHGRKVLITGIGKECQHEMVEYHGFNDSFRYCKKCDKKE